MRRCLKQAWNHFSDIVQWSTFPTSYHVTQLDNLGGSYSAPTEIVLFGSLSFLYHVADLWIGDENATSVSDLKWEHLNITLSHNFPLMSLSRLAQDKNWPVPPHGGTSCETSWSSKFFLQVFLDLWDEETRIFISNFEFGIFGKSWLPSKIRIIAGWAPSSRTIWRI